MEDLVKATRDAGLKLSMLSTEARNEALEKVAQGLEKRAADIVAANEADLAAGTDLPPAILGRLKLDATKLAGAVEGVRKVARLADPLGLVDVARELDEGLTLRRESCPLGVVGVIFEARPDALVQICALAIKSGNGVVLKGGKEALKSFEALVAAIHEALRDSPVQPEAVLLLTTRSEIKDLLECKKYVDLIIPRGGNALVKYVKDNTDIPVIGHADGLCHLYVHEDADVAQAVAIAVDSKTQYPSACNAIETMLVNEKIAAAFLPAAVEALRAKGVEVRGCAKTAAVVADVVPTKDSDWAEEYCDLVLAVRVVPSLDDALDHIRTYGSKHTECIATTDAATGALFQARVDAASVFVNASTRFADGFRYGLGAEVGISTQKMPPRGPVGLEGLTTYKYKLVGGGHVAATYAGADAKPFLHRDL